ncbi:MAG: 3-isopropylmalate dehydrogenase [Clostridiales bacterium]|nr:3-isopropylmalate dehydrogenase [Clostridiales bacterium]
MEYDITMLPGDGVGPEVMNAASTVLSAIESKFGHKFNLNKMPFGGAALDKVGVPLPEETLEVCKSSDAVIRGPVGGPKWDNFKPHLRPEHGLWELRSGLGLFANLKPVQLYSEMINSCPLNHDIAKKGIDILMIREISGGVYFGAHGFRDGALGQEAFDTTVYSISEIERIAEVAFEVARTRRKRVTSVDMSSILDTGKLWRATFERVAKRYPDVKLQPILLLDCISRLLKDPSQFDVIVTGNLFGRILSEQASAMVGSGQMLPSHSLGTGKVRLYGPIHGALHTIAGKDEVNPISMILATAMMLSNSLQLINEAYAIETAVHKVLAKGLRTADIAGDKKSVSCSRMTEEIALTILNK